LDASGLRRSDAVGFRNRLICLRCRDSGELRRRASSRRAERRKGLGGGNLKDFSRVERIDEDAERERETARLATLETRIAGRRWILGPQPALPGGVLRRDFDAQTR